MKCRILKTKDWKQTQKYSLFHKAVDGVGENNTLDHITAHSDGEVVFCQRGQQNNKKVKGNLSYGNCVKIKHKEGYYTLYAHLDTVLVKEKQKIKKGTILGYMGNTGKSFGAHLHFEVWKGNTRINPAKYIYSDFLSTPPNKITYYPKYMGTSNSIVDALKSIKVNSSFMSRKEIASKNGISNYIGTSNQNIKLLSLLKEGKLKK